MRRRLHRLLVAGACLMVALLPSISCSESNGPVFGPITEDFSGIEDPYERWQAYDLQDYRIRQERTCFCPPPRSWIAYVRNGKVVAVGPDNRPLSHEERERALQMAWTVEEAFAMAEEIEEGGPDVFQVTYDERFGFPNMVFVDWSTGQADDEVWYSSSDLEAALDW